MKYPFHHKANTKLFGFAKEMRKKPTHAEAVLWSYLKNRQQLGAKFRRQHPLGPFVVDFYCHESSFIVEVDGPIHEMNDNSSYDKDRTDFLNNIGLRVVRFTNDEVLKSTGYVLRTIRHELTIP